MVVCTVKVFLSPDRRAEVLEVLHSIRGPVLARGCASCHVYEEHDPDEAVVLVERWESEAALEAHIRSETFRRIISAIELSCGPPEISFDSVTATRGMELIERLRGTSA
jgi:quinol monooxygenase YgiN